MYKAIGKDTLILICGAGSIGERHLNNLLALGYENIILYRTRNEPLRTVNKKFPVFLDLKDALKENPEISFITNPTSLHMETAINCARSGSHIFIEKPLSNSTESIDKLKDIAEKNKIKVMIGYMMRFHPCIKEIKKIIDEKRIGNIISTISVWGEYLPDWHPWEDYSTSYAAKKTLGGGPALTLSHDLDLLVYLFGKPDRLKAFANYNSDLSIDTESSIDIILKYKNGIVSNVHLDYLQKPPNRVYLFIGDKGEIKFYYFENKVEIYTGSSSETFTGPKGFERNDMFIEEIKYFINCIESDIEPSPGIDEAAISLNIALKAIESDKHEKGVKL
ncbi:MAG: Gfo/Idh/MocA family oxidoreductase [Actinomycetota bacterium]|nr:Gfo/Idh/MocA family oxidoreductase [Actinomycetota bacterium]